MKAIIYTRVSDPSQIENNSLDTQEKACRKFAEQKGYEVIEPIYVEEGKSAKNVSSRPVLRTLLAFACNKKNKVDALIVYKYDRFSRNLEEGLATISLLAKYHIEVLSVTEDVDPSPMGKALRNIMMTLGELDNELKGVRVKDNMIAVFRKGYWPFKCPIGYRRPYKTKEENKGKPVMLHPQLAPIVRNMFVNASTGMYNRSQLARIMNEDGFKTHYRREATHKIVNELLQKTFYFGYMFAPKWQEYAWGKHEKLIDRETWEKAYRAVIKKKLDYNYQDDELYPLKGHLKCISCGHPLTTAPSRGRTKLYFYYECRNKACSNRVRIDRDSAHEQMLARMISIKPSERTLKLFDHLVFSEWDMVIDQSHQAAKKLQEKINDLVEEQDSIRKAKDDGLYTLDEAKVRIDKLRQEITVLEIERSEKKIEEYDTEVVREFTNHFISNLDKLWAKVDYQKKQVLQEKVFCGGIVCTKDKEIRITKLSPSFALIKQWNEENGENVTPLGFEPKLPG